jgi:hypothetical protein
VSHWQIGDVRISKFVEKEFAGIVHRFLLLDATLEIVPLKTTCF